MFRLSRLILTLSLLCASLCPQAQVLWKISGNGLARPSYLLGTHHMVNPSVILDRQAVKEAIAQCDEAVGELLLDPASQSQLQSMLQSCMMAPADSMLTSVLTKAEMDRLNTLLEHYTGVTGIARQMSALKPASVELALTAMQQAASAQSTLLSSTEPLDMAIQNVFTDAGKRLWALETPAMQASLLFSAPIAQQARSLMRAVDNDAKAGEYLSTLLRAYIDGDLDKLLTIMRDPDVGVDDADAERMIYSRNRQWIDLIVAALPGASLLIAVGAGHLPGAKGLIALLREQGYNVEPVE